jgi:hypothetical protein
MKAIIARGRMANGMKFNITYDVRLPVEDEERRRSYVFTRSLRSQGVRTDKDLERQNRNLLRYRVIPYNTVDERIENDQEYRLKLARKILNCNANFAPAAILMSDYHRKAYRLAIQHQEMKYEQAGLRTRKTAREQMDD